MTKKDTSDKVMGNEQPPSHIKDSASGRSIANQESSNVSRTRKKDEQESVTSSPRKGKSTLNFSLSNLSFRNWVALSGFAMLLIAVVLGSVRVRNANFVLTTSSNLIEADVISAFRSESMKVNEWSLVGVQTLTLPNRESRKQIDVEHPLAIRPCVNQYSDCCAEMSDDPNGGE